MRVPCTERIDCIWCYPIVTIISKWHKTPRNDLGLYAWVLVVIDKRVFISELNDDQKLWAATVGAQDGHLRVIKLWTLLWAIVAIADSINTSAKDWNIYLSGNKAVYILQLEKVGTFGNSVSRIQPSDCNITRVIHCHHLAVECVVRSPNHGQVVVLETLRRREKKEYR